MQPPPYSPPPEPSPHLPKASRHTPLAIRFLRVIVWCSPSITIVAAGVGMLFFRAPTWITLPALCLVLVAAGCFDAILSRSTPVTDGKPDLGPMVRYCTRYIVIQLIFAPVLSFFIAVVLVFVNLFIQRHARARATSILDIGVSSCNLITIPHLSPSPYSLFLLLAIIVSAAYWIRHSKNDPLLPLVYAAALGGAFLGAKIAFLAAEGWFVPAGDHRWIHLLTGKSVTGALLGGFLGVELAKRLVGYKKITGDRFALIAPIGIMIGRIGCLTHGCCQGIACNLGPFSTRGPDGIANWPAVPVEMLFNLLAVTAVILLRRAGRFPNQLFHLYLIAYGLFRFAHEFLRATPKPFLGLSGYQVIALLLALTGALAYRIRAKSMIPEGSRPLAGG